MNQADMQDNYLDAYVSVLQNADPLNTSLVFNCGMGVVRSKFMVMPGEAMISDFQLRSACVLRCS
jgi:hypothetical protein